MSIRIGNQIVANYTEPTLSATTTTEGKVRFATDQEVAAGTSTNSVVTPAQLDGALNNLIDQTYDSTSSNAQSGSAIAGAGFLRNTATGTDGLTIEGAPVSQQACTNIGSNSNIIDNGTDSSILEITMLGANTNVTVSGTNNALRGGVVIGSSASISVTGTEEMVKNVIAIGELASVTADSAIQIGRGTNSTATTLSIGFGSSRNYQLLDGTTGLIPDARISNNIVKSVNNTSPDTNGNVTIQTGSSLPDQTGHSGDILTTDGTDASWVDTAQVYPVIETYINGNDWYRIWAPDSTGYRWCEQGSLYYKGSTMAGTDNTITFLKTFKDTNYTFIPTPLHSTANLNQYQIYEKYDSRTASTTVLRITSAIFGYSWVAKGYIADGTN